MNDKPRQDPPVNEPVETAGLDARFPELAELQREIELRLRDNQRFLERFMDEDFEDEPPEEDEGELFEEL